MENLPDQKRGKVLWKQNLYYSPSLKESSSSSSRGTRIRFNYLYFVIMHLGKKGFFFVAGKKEKKNMASGTEFTFLWIILLTKKKNIYIYIFKKGGKNGVYMQKGPRKNAAALIFFFAEHPIIQRCPAGRPIPGFEWKLTLNDTMFKESRVYTFLYKRRSRLFVRDL